MEEITKKMAQLEAQGRKILVIVMIMLGVILISLSSVNASTFDNVKSFNKNVKNYGKATITNAFGLGSKLQELTLMDNTFNCSNNCYAEIPIQIFQNSSLIDSIRFDKIKHGGIRENTILEYSDILLENGTINITDISNPSTCTIVSTLINGTNVYNCSSTRKEVIRQEKTYRHYNLGEVLPLGNYTIKIVGSKPEKTTIDWIITSQGKEITDWAVWGAYSITTYTNTTFYPSAVGTGGTGDQGVQCTANQNITISGFKIWDLDTSNSWKVGTTIGGSELGSGTINGKYNNTMRVNVTSGTTFYFYVYGGTLSYNNINQAFPYSNANLNCTGSLYQGNAQDTGVLRAFENITTSTTTTIATNGAVNLTLPVNYYNSSTRQVTFNFSTSGHSVNLQNISLLIQSNTWNVNQTFTTGSVKNYSVLTYQNFSDGRYNYSAIACDIDGDCGYPQSNITFLVDTTNPLVNIIYPTNNSEIITLNNQYNITLNASVSDNLGLSNCWVYNETSNANQSITCNANLSIPLMNGYHNFIYYANDTAGNYNNNLSRFLINYINTSVNYTSSLKERENTTINLTILANNINYLSGNITYNGTTNNLISSYNSTYGFLYYDLVTPSVTSDTIIKFNITYNINGQNYTIYNYNQTIINYASLTFGASCSNGLSSAYNFTLIDEVNRTNISGTISYNFRYGSPDNITLNELYGSLVSSSFSICINSTNYNAYKVGYGELQYQGVGDYINRRYYLFENTLLSNDTINVSLYNAHAGDSSSFLFEVQDQTSLDPYINAYLTLLRWYPQLNSYQIVEMGKTDDKGQTILRVKTEDVDYKTGIYYSNGTLIDLTNPVRFVCLTSPCTYSIKVEQTALDYTDIFGVSSNLSYNNNTKIFTFTWNDPSQRTSYMNLSVYRLSGDNDTEICKTGSSGFSGSIGCNVSLFSGSFRAVAYRSASPSRPISELIVDAVKAVLNNKVGLFISIILLILIVLVGIFSPIVALFLTIVALIPALMLGAINLTIFTGVIVLVFIIFWMIRRDS